MATLALPLAALSAAITQAFIFGNTPALHVARLASRSPPLPIPCMHARTIGEPTVCRQFSMACSFESADAGSEPARTANKAIRPAATYPVSGFAMSQASKAEMLRVPDIANSNQDLV